MNHFTIVRVITLLIICLSTTTVMASEISGSLQSANSDTSSGTIAGTVIAENSNSSNSSHSGGNSGSSNRTLQTNGAVLGISTTTPNFPNAGFGSQSMTTSFVLLASLLASLVLLFGRYRHYLTHRL